MKKKGHPPIDKDPVIPGIQEDIRSYLMEFIQIYMGRLEELDEFKSEARNWSSLYEIGKTLSSILTLDPLLEKVVDYAIDITGAERGFIVLPSSDEGFLFRTARGKGGKSLPDSERAISRSIVEKVMNDGIPIAIDDLNEESMYSKKESVLFLGLRSVLSVPLLFKGKISGAIYVDSQKGGTPFTESSQATLQALASQAAVAMENTRLYHELERRTAEKEKARRLASVGTMAAGIAHEIRNPLGIISNAIYFLKSTEPECDPDRLEQYDIVSQEVQRANRIITDLLSYARIRPPEKSEINFNALIRDCTKQAVAAKLVQNQQIKMKIPRKIIRLSVDSDQLRQVMYNLIQNAGRYIHENGLVTIHLKTHSKGIKLSLSNDGPVIPENILDRLFEPFFSTRTDGAGLGLSIVQTIINLHGGTIVVQNLPIGCEFTVFLPFDS